MVSIETVSPEFTVSFGISFGSSQPHCTVCRVAARRWVFASEPAFWATAELQAKAASTAARAIFPACVGIMVAPSLCGRSYDEPQNGSSSRPTTGLGKATLYLNREHSPLRLVQPGD